MLTVFMVPVALDLAKNQKDLLNPALLSKWARNIPFTDKIGRNGTSGFSFCLRFELIRKLT